MKDKREFEIDQKTIDHYSNCLVCKKDFKIGEKIVLCPIQEPIEGYASVLSIPIHSSCYWI